jgi:hypothetical protein
MLAFITSALSFSSFEIFLVFAFRLLVVQLNPRTDFVTLLISRGPLRFTIPLFSPSKYSALARLGQRYTANDTAEQ